LMDIPITDRLLADVTPHLEPDGVFVRCSPRCAPAARNRPICRCAAPNGSPCWAAMAPAR
jgi:hypothetical protein